MRNDASSEITLGSGQVVAFVLVSLVLIGLSVKRKRLRQRTSRKLPPQSARATRGQIPACAHVGVPQEARFLR